MLTQQKYLLALTISHIVSSLMVINEIHSKLQYQMNIYIFLPVAILIATSIAYKYVQSMLIYVASFTVLAICSFIFWSNETIIKEVFLHKPSYGCIIYLVIMIISAIVMPFTSPNSIFGIRIPQTEDYQSTCVYFCAIESDDITNHYRHISYGTSLQLCFM